MIGVAAVALVVALILLSGGESDHLTAVFDQAVLVTPGLNVDINDVPVGSVTSVRYVNGQAVVGLGLSDGAWPLHRGTTATIRYGTTLGNGTRYIDLQPGPRDAPSLGENAILPVSRTNTPVEFDQVFNMMDTRARGQLQQLTQETGAEIGARAPQINNDLHAAPGALSAVSGVLGELGADTSALHRLVINTDSLTATLAARQRQISDVISGSAKTFQTFAANTGAIDGSLSVFPSALREARGTLRRVDVSVAGLRGLIDDLRPGLPELSALAVVARPALAELRATAPIAVRTLAAGRAQAPAIASLLSAGIPFAGKAAADLGGLTPMLACLRPYAPEIAGTASNWGSYAHGYDSVGHYASMQLLTGPTALTSTPPVNEAALLKLGQETYALPRPPGLNAGQPWLQPQCGAGGAALDPTQDPEHQK